MPVLTLAVEVAENAVRQSSGRHQGQFSGSLEAELRVSGPWGVALEVGATGAAEASTNLAFTQVLVRPAVLATLTFSGRHFGAMFGVGPAVSITTAIWDAPSYGAAVFVEPGVRGRTGLIWHVNPHFGVQILGGATSRGGGSDVDLGAGVRWTL